jgi:hypothetical protein
MESLRNLGPPPCHHRGTVRASTATRILIGVIALMGISALLGIVRGGSEAREAVGGFLFVAVVIGGALWLGHRYRVAPRRGSFRDQAEAAGLRAGSGDPLGLLELPFALLGRAVSVREIENTATGTRDGASVVVADYWFSPSAAPERDDVRRYTCVLTNAPGWWPDLSVVPEGLASRLRSSLGLPDVELESEEFNRRFEVRASDRRFASALLDARMMTWLLEQVPGAGFEVRSARLLVFRPRPTASLDDVARALEMSDAFADRIPRVVRSGPI